MKLLNLKCKVKSVADLIIVRHYSNSHKFVNKALSGNLNYEKDFLETHIRTTFFQKVLLGLGSGFMSITDPRRGDMVAVMGETTGVKALEYIRSKMLQSEEGKKILEEKPRISSSSVDLERLKKMPEGTLGKAYSNFLERYKYSPDERLNVRFVDDFELAYVATRYREAHDLFHTILDMPTNMLGEVTVKWVEAIQTRLPMCATGAFFGPLRLAPKFTRTYSTSVRAVLDPDILDEIKNNKTILRKSPWSVRNNFTEIPEHIEKNILLILKMNNATLSYECCKKFNTSLLRRILPWKAHRKQFLLEKYRTQLLEEMVGPLTEQDTKYVSQATEKFNKQLDNLPFRINFDKNTSLIYLMSRAPYEYAAVLRIFKEISLKDPEFKPRTLLDFGSGVGTAVWAAKTLWESSVKDYVAVDISNDMNELAFSIIQPNIKMKPLIKNFIQKRFIPLSDAEFDVVVSAFTFFDVGNYEERMRYLFTLWKNTSTYLVLVENGTKNGFHIINEAREMILQETNSMNYLCHIAAPCPHELSCPMLLNKNEPCTFMSKYKQLGLHRESVHNESPFTYVVFKKGRRDAKQKNWPRVLRDVKLHNRMTTCNFCTPEGQMTGVNISKKKYDKETYRFSRNLKDGDVFPGRICFLNKKSEKGNHTQSKKEEN